MGRVLMRPIGEPRELNPPEWHWWGDRWAAFAQIASAFILLLWPSLVEDKYQLLRNLVVGGLLLTGVIGPLIIWLGKMCLISGQRISAYQDLLHLYKSRSSALAEARQTIFNFLQNQTNGQVFYVSRAICDEWGLHIVVE